MLHRRGISSRSGPFGVAGLTLRGLVTLGGGIAWCVAAALLGQRDLLWPGIFLVLLPLASWLILLLSGGRPTLRRSVAPLEVAAGGRVVSRLEVAGHGPGLGAVTSYVDDSSAALRGRAESSFPLGLTAGPHRMEHRLTPAWRGRHRIGPLQRSISDGLGLARARRVLPGTVEVLALPAVHPLAPLRNASGVGSTTESAVLRTSLVGQDDALVREYAPGDDVRRIHWRSTARIGQLMVRREERAWDPSAVVLVDNRRTAFAAVSPDPRFEWLVSAAASICVHLLDHGFSVALTDTDALPFDSPDRAMAGAAAHLRRLAALERSASGSLDAAMSASPSGVRGQLLIVLLGRLTDHDAEALVDAHRDHRTCWALVPEPAGVSAEALRLLEAAGWRCLRVPEGTSVPRAWALLGEGNGS